MPAAPAQNITHLYRDHHSWLLALLQRRLGNQPDAADLAHDTFVRLLQRDSEGINFREPRAYLTRIAQGLLINHWRRRDIELAYLQALAAMPAIEAPCCEERAVIMETLYEIDAALSNLPMKVKQAFLMAQLEGVPYREIAVRLEVSEISIKRYVKRALVECLLVLE